MNNAKRALRKLYEWTDTFRKKKISYGTVKEINYQSPFNVGDNRVLYYDTYVIETDDGNLYWDFMEKEGLKWKDIQPGRRVRMEIDNPSKNRSSKVPRRAYARLLEVDKNG